MFIIDLLLNMLSEHLGEIRTEQALKSVKCSVNPHRLAVCVEPGTVKVHPLYQGCCINRWCYNLSTLRFMKAHHF